MNPQGGTADLAGARPGSTARSRALLGTPLPAAQSFLLIWPQLTGLVAMMIMIFAIAHVVFERQEIRA